MRKTLFTLAFTAIVSVGANAATVAPLHSWEWTTEGAAVGNSNKMTFAYTEGNDYASFGQSNKPWTTSLDGAISGSFTISFDVRNLSATNNNWQTMFGMYSNNAAHGDANSLQLQFNSEGTLMLYNKVATATSYGGAGTPQTTDAAGNDSNSISSGITTTDLQSATDWINFSVVSDLENNTLSLFVNGEEAGVLHNWNPESPALTGLQFGSAFGATRLMAGPAQINNVFIYNHAVYPIPEPATASLSLLGLAALLMRRRRA